MAMTMQINVRNVWEANLVEEFRLIGEIMHRNPYVALATKFPGDVVESGGYFREPSYKYDSMRENVNRFKLIQLGLTFSNIRGVLPRYGVNNRLSVWQFNFREFNPNEDEHVPASISLLRDSGIDLERNQREGVALEAFGELLMGSGALMNPNVTWLTFDGGRDFGCLLKLVQGEVKKDSKEFLEALSVYCPVTYDVKHLMRYTDSLHGGLNTLGTRIGARIDGARQQAGADSLLTSTCFFRVRNGGYFTAECCRCFKEVQGSSGWNKMVLLSS